MNIHMQRQTTGMPYLLKDKQCIQQITRPRMGNKTQADVQQCRAINSVATARLADMLDTHTYTHYHDITRSPVMKTDVSDASTQTYQKKYCYKKNRKVIT